MRRTQQREGNPPGDLRSRRAGEMAVLILLLTIATAVLVGCSSEPDVEATVESRVASIAIEATVEARIEAMSPTATPRPTSTPRPTPTPTPYPETRNKEATFTVSAGRTKSLATEYAPAKGYWNFSVKSRHDVDSSKPLDIYISVRGGEGGPEYCRGYITSETASVPVDRGERAGVLMDNEHSTFAGKAVTVQYSWSKRAKYSVGC